MRLKAEKCWTRDATQPNRCKTLETTSSEYFYRCVANISEAQETVVAGNPFADNGPPLPVFDERN